MTEPTSSAHTRESALATVRAFVDATRDRDKDEMARHVRFPAALESMANLRECSEFQAWFDRLPADAPVGAFGPARDVLGAERADRFAAELGLEVGSLAALRLGVGEVLFSGAAIVGLDEGRLDSGNLLLVVRP